MTCSTGLELFLVASELLRLAISEKGRRDGAHIHSLLIPSEESLTAGIEHGAGSVGADPCFCRSSRILLMPCGELASLACHYDATPRVGQESGESG